MPQKIWQSVLEQLQLQVSKPNFDTWLKDTRGVSFGKDSFVVGVPNAFVAEWLRERLSSLIRRTLSNVIGRTVDVQFTVLPGEPAPSQPQTYADGGTTTKVPPRTKPERLKTSYTFETFVPGECNRIAYAAALEVLESPGAKYNPLFIYGDTGTGKTHLLHAIAHTARSRGFQVICTTAEQFTNQYVLALKNNSIDEFHDHFRNTDFLLIDDVQFLSGKTQTQECLVHIFNDLYYNSGQMVMTSDCLPKTIPAVNTKLSSRLVGGLVVRLSPPDFETSVAILTAKAAASSAVVPSEVLRFLATQFKSSVRELEGALNRVLTYAKLSGANKVDMTVALQALADMGEGKSPLPAALTPKLVIDAVATHYGISPDVILGKQRDKQATLARQVVIYLLRQEKHYSLTEIGNLLNRDHSTILHNFRRISQSIKTDTDLAHSVEQLRGQLRRR